MFWLLKHKKKEKISEILPKHNYGNICSTLYEAETQYRNHNDGKMARLMELISHAIDDWAVEYNMEKLPKKIIFEQALDAMRAIELALKFKE